MVVAPGLALIQRFPKSEKNSVELFQEDVTIRWCPTKKSVDGKSGEADRLRGFLLIQKNTWSIFTNLTRIFVFHIICQETRLPSS